MFTVKIAEIPIGIMNHWEGVRFVCEDYIVDEEPLFTVSASVPEMEKHIPKGYGIGYAEELSIFRAISEKIPAYDAFLMHAAVIDLDGHGIAFSAASGTGKTTRVRLWQEAFGERLNVVNGDKPFLRFSGDQLIAYGTPWNGKENMGSNSSVPLKGICFLERREEVALKQLSVSEALPRMLRQIFIPNEEKQLNRLLSLITRTFETIPCFLLYCNQEKEKPKEIWTQMKGLIG